MTSKAAKKPAPPLSAAALAAQREMASRILARRRLLPFIQRMNPKYMAGWVHEDVCRRLEQFSQDVADRKSPRLMLLMPPRAGKSEIASKSFPPWHMGHYPDHEIIACSYNVGLAMDFSKRIKALIDDPAYQSVFEIRLDPDNRSSESWGLKSQPGSYVAAGVGGGINGKGAHILIIDDPIKNAEEADSAQTRESIWNWFGSTAYTRLAPGGGVLIIQCMTGDTPVLMASGEEQRLDTLTVGAAVATFANGKLATSTVLGLKSNGRDSVLKITTRSGRMVRANGRHPFLATIDGELKWIRARSLTTAHKIVALKDSGGSGRALPVVQKDVQRPLFAGGSARRTTTSRNGLTGLVLQALTPSHAVTPTLNTAIASLPLTTSLSSRLKMACAPFARNLLALISHITGKTSSPSITATKPVKCGGYCATTATRESDILELSPWHLPQPGTSDFTLDEIVSIEPDGVEEVFDVQVEHTENFIANGLVSHNTWWHDDDLAGRLQAEMAAARPDDPDVDRYEVVKYPAIAEHDEYLDYDTDQIAYDTAPENGRLLRSKGEALHPARFDLKKLNTIKRTIPARFWSALYQQNPVPDDGSYFTKDQFKRGALPSHRNCKVFIAWDFAISERAHNDYTVGTVGLQDTDDLLHVAEVVRFKSGDAFFIVESILNLAKRWYHPSLSLGFEDGQIFRAVEALLRKRMRETKFYPSVTVLKPITDKMARGRVLQGRMQQGMVSFNQDAEWYDTVRNEMLRFPAGVHDDCVDSMAWMAQMAVGSAPPKDAAVKPMKSWRDRLNGGMAGASHMAA